MRTAIAITFLVAAAVAFAWAAARPGPLSPVHFIGAVCWVYWAFDVASGGRRK